MSVRQPIWVKVKADFYRIKNNKPPYKSINKAFAAVFIMFIHYKKGKPHKWFAFFLFKNLAVRI